MARRPGGWMRHALVVAMLGGAWTPALARPAAVPAVRRGTPYAAVRRMLLAAGFAPFRLKERHMTRTACGGDDPICRAYPETAFCGETGLGHCEFLFARGAEVLVVETTGETVPRLAVEGISRSDRASVGQRF